MNLPKGQQWFISKMKAAGLKANDEGVCFGFSHMAMQASLANDMETFTNRLELLNELPLEYFEKFKPQEGETEHIKMTQDDVDIFAFLQGIDLYFQAHEYAKLYPDLFADSNIPLSQTEKPSIPLLQPKNISGIKEAFSIIDIYVNQKSARG